MKTNLNATDSMNKQMKKNILVYMYEKCTHFLFARRLTTYWFEW